MLALLIPVFSITFGKRRITFDWEVLGVCDIVLSFAKENGEKSTCKREGVESKSR